MASIQQPGTTVIQELRTVSPTVATATLPACIIGPAYEVVDVLDSDGLLNADAATEVYSQAALSILQSSYPAPRGNADELNVDEASVRGFLLENNILTELPRGDGGPTGSAFLAESNLASRPSFVSERGDALAAVPWSIANGDTLVIAIDNPVAADESEDVTVTIAAAGANATAAEVIASINAAFGKTVASIFTPTDPVAAYVQISSTNWGASASVTLRGGTALGEFMWDVAVRRIEASGYRVQDDLDGDLTSPWIEFFVGANTRAGGAVAWGPTPGAGGGTGAGRILEGDAAGAAHTAGAATPQIFSGPGTTVPLQASSATRAGDLVYVDGVQLSTGEVLEVQASRFRMGTLNTALSTFDSDGDPTTRVYDVAESNVMIHSIPLAPRNVWFQAQGLQWGSISPAPVAAVLTGSVSAASAQAAEIQSDTPIPDATLAPVDLTGLTLIIGRVVDGVAQPNETFTFPGGSSYGTGDTAALAADIDAGLSSDLVVSAYRDVSATQSWLRFRTVKTGQDQQVSLILAGSTAAATLGFTADASHTGKDAEFANSATRSSVVWADPGNTVLTAVVVDSRGTHSLSYTLTGAPYANAAAMLVELNDQANQIAWNGDIEVLDWTEAAGELVATSKESGLAVNVTVGGVAGGAMNFPAPAGAGTDDLDTTQLLWSMDGSGCAYDLTFTSDSIDDAIAAINLLTGMTVASKTVGDALVLTSPMGGTASVVSVDSASTADMVLGLATTAVNGSGRPNPDFYLDLAGSATFGAQILRNALTGQPFCPASAQAFLQYKGLRLDVSALSTASEKLLTIDDTIALAAALSPLDDENPLGLGMFLALLNSPTTAVTGIGVDAVSTALPEGTLEAYARSADVLEAKDVYGLVPLSANAQVHQLFSTHVTAMSQPTQRGERIVFINPPVPDRAYATVLASGDSNSTANSNELALDQNPSAAIVAGGLNPAVLTADDGVYVEVTVSNELRRYNVSAVSGSLLTLRTTFAAGENDDSFYSTTTLSTTLIDVDYTMRLRGDLLLITGTTLTDLPAVATAVGAAATAYRNRRVFYVFPDEVSVSLTAGLTNVPAYFAAAAVAGMVGQLNPSQGFTNYPITGLASVQGSNDTFKPSQLDTIAGGGVYVLYQTVAGAPVTCRHQLSTDTTSVERRELSITKAVDYVAKFLRNALRNFIGSFNITPAFLDQLSTIIQGQLAFLGTEGLGVVAAATLNNVIQDEDNPDTILVDVTLEVLYPANYIRVTLVV